MTVNYTTLLRLVQPVTGTESGTWGDYVNNALAAYVDVAVAGTQTLSTDANISLTLTDGTNSATNLGATSAQYAILNLTGARTAIRTVTLPTSSRSYIVLNNTTGGFASTVGGVSVAAGEDCVIVYDTSATAYVKVASSISNLASVTGTLGVANGGTGATTQQTAINALAGATTSAQYLRGNGTNVVMSAIQVADVPTLNQNTTGNAGTVTNGVYTTGNQTISGTKTFSSGVVLGSSTLAPSGSAPSYAARVWVNFNGTGTVAIRASGNVTSITDNGIGDYTVNFTTALADADYSIVGLGCALSDGDTSTLRGAQLYGPTALATTSARIKMMNGLNNESYDSPIACISVFR